MDKKAELKAVIDAYEKRTANLQLTLNRINQLTGKDIEAHEITEYRSYTSLDELCDRLLAEPIANWESIDDEKAFLLIKEIVENIANDIVVDRNSDALEKRYHKTTGFISTLIFQADVIDEHEILLQLKKDTTIYL